MSVSFSVSTDEQGVRTAHYLIPPGDVLRDPMVQLGKFWLEDVPKKRRWRKRGQTFPFWVWECEHCEQIESIEPQMNNSGLVLDHENYACRMLLEHWNRVHPDEVYACRMLDEVKGEQYEQPEASETWKPVF